MHTQEVKNSETFQGNVLSFFFHKRKPIWSLEPSVLIRSLEIASQLR